MVKADEPLVYTYGYHEVKIILEGNLNPYTLIGDCVNRAYRR